MKLGGLLLAAAVSGCEGVHDLGGRGCLPVKLPAQVVLQQEAALYSRRGNPKLILLQVPRDTTNDAFNGMAPVRPLKPGAGLRIREVTQAWGFDTGDAGIIASGTTQDGQDFDYYWGFRDQLSRAPWDSASDPASRTIHCGS